MTMAVLASAARLSGSRPRTRGGGKKGSRPRGNKASTLLWDAAMKSGKLTRNKAGQTGGRLNNTR